MGKMTDYLSEQVDSCAKAVDALEGAIRAGGFTMTPEQRRKLDASSSVTWGKDQSFSEDDFRLMLDAVAAAQIAGTLGQKQEQPLRDLYVKVAGLLKGTQDGTLDKNKYSRRYDKIEFMGAGVHDADLPVEPLSPTTVRKTT